MIDRIYASLGGAFVLHAALAFGIAKVPQHLKQKKLVEFKVNKVAPPVKAPPPPPPPPPPEPEPPKPKAKKPEVAKAPIPNTTKPPPEPPKTPPKPVFGVSMDSTTTGDSSFTVPVGNTTMADPKAPRPAGPVQPLGPAPPAAQPAPQWKPATEAEIARAPEFEDGSCDAQYPDGEAKQAGVEGETVLRVEIDESGKVHGARVLKGVGHGLDEIALKLVKTKCRYSAAVNKAGKPVPFVITHYVTWKIE